MTSGSYDISQSRISYYVWAKDAAGNVGKSNITAYELKKVQGTNTTLIFREGSSSGTILSNTSTPVLRGTNIYVEASASTGYSVQIKYADTSTSYIDSGTVKELIANTEVTTTAIANEYTITLDNQNANTVGTASLTEKYGDGIYNGSNKMTSTSTITLPTKTGYTFGGYYTNTNGNGTQMITEDGNLTSSFTNTYYTSNNILYAKWTDNGKPTVIVERVDYNTFSWTASDDVGVTGWQITTSSTKPSATSLGWTTTGNLTSGTRDVTATGTYYVWAKDAEGNVNDASSSVLNPTQITAYTMTRNEGVGTTLTTKVDGATSTTGTAVTQNTVVLVGTPIWVMATANEGYNTPVLKAGTSTINASGQQVMVTVMDLELSSTATANTATITVRKDGSAWSESGVKVDLYQNGISKKTTTVSSGSTASFSEVPAGTYDIYATRVKSQATTLYDTGVDITVGNTGTATIDYYTLTRNQGANTTLTTKLDSSTGTAITSTTQVLKNTRVYISATVDDGYILSLTVGNDNFRSGNTKQITTATEIKTLATQRDITAPTITITRLNHRQFEWSAIDNVGVAGTQITTTDAEPTSEEWLGEPFLNGGTFDMGNQGVEGTYYVWAKDEEGNISYSTINAYTLTRNEGENTTLTIRDTDSDGDIIDNSRAIFEGTIIYVEASADEGYELLLTANETNFNSEDTIQIMANTEIKSVATENLYVITLDSNGAIDEGTRQIYEKYEDGIYLDSNLNEKMTLSNNTITVPEKNSYAITLNFNGNEQEDETIIMEDEFLGYYDGETQMINEAGYITSEFTSTKYTSNKTLIAQWEDIHGPLPTTDDDWTEKLEREGYTFEGWYTDEECTDGNEVNSEDYVPTQDITLYAKWVSIGEPPLPEPEVYTITYRNVEDAEFEEDNPTTYTEETEDFTLCNPTREGYTFEGWRGTDIDDIETEVTIEQGSTGNREYEAVWKEIEEEPEPTNRTNTNRNNTNTNTNTSKINTNTNNNSSRTNTSSSSTNRSASNNSKSNITTKTYKTNTDNTTATKILSKTGSINLLLIISTIVAVTLGIILVIKEIKIRE